MLLLLYAGCFVPGFLVRDLVLLVISPSVSWSGRGCLAFWKASLHEGRSCYIPAFVGSREFVLFSVFRLVIC